MRPPSIRLTDRGNGPETIRVDPADWPQDEEANAIKTPGSGVDYPAIVTRDDSAMISDNGTKESTTAYRVTAITATDPGIAVETVVVWTPGRLPPRVLVANGQASPQGPNAWGFSAMEVDPNSSGSNAPVNEQG